MNGRKFARIFGLLGLLVLSGCGAVASTPRIGGVTTLKETPTAPVMDMQPTLPPTEAVNVEIAASAPPLLTTPTNSAPGQPSTATPYVVGWILYGTPTPTRAATQPDSAQPAGDYIVGWLLYGSPTPTPGPALPTATPTPTAQQPAEKTPVALTPQANPGSGHNMEGMVGTPTPRAGAQLRPGNAAQGASIFSGLGTCGSCHDTNSGVKIVGPSLKGVASRAGSRIPGMSANSYLRESILQPNKFVVPGYTPGLMPQIFAQTLSVQQINDIIAYLLTLK